MLNLSKYIYFVLFILFVNADLYSQSSICFSVSDDDALPNELFRYSELTEEWTKIGLTGTDDVGAIAINDITGVIFGVDGGVTGTIDPVTGAFDIIDTIGIANGANGPQIMDNIKGLTFNTVDNILFGTQRIPGYTSGTNDLLIQIDPTTGDFIPGVFSGNDYVVIEEAFDITANSDVYDVGDIAYDSYLGNLFTIQNSNYAGFGVISIISSDGPYAGTLTQVVYDNSAVFLEGLGFREQGFLYATTAKEDGIGFGPEGLLKINYYDLSTDELGLIDTTGQLTKFESIDCIGGLVDLELNLSLSSGQSSTVTNGDTVTFDIQVINNGDNDAHEIIIIDYLPDDVFLTNNNPQWSYGTPFTSTINYLAAGGADTTILIEVVINTLQDSITNSVEIAGSRNENGAIQYDIDSTPNSFLINADEDDSDSIQLMVMPIVISNGPNPTEPEINIENLSIIDGTLIFKNNNDISILKVINAEGKTLIKHKVNPLSTLDLNLNSIKDQIVYVTVENKEGIRSERFKL